ncbi:hypothetical protein EDB85DRAFT_1869165 [Lactarius pseudohatsudake]|nr:hypothetical protein EDB85DRAFT_1870536 [Lactarius pseudohatsudake]KAH9026070.1 hypothetical protein EDB85DRAFT_1869165 [Lactarius pseudohatsudake]
MTSQLSPSISSQGSPSPRSARASTLSVLPIPAPATQFAADPTVPALTFVSSHGETALQPCDDTGRDPVRSLITDYVSSWPANSSTGASSLDQYREKSVGDQLQPMTTAATTERNKAARAAQWRGWALNAAIASQVLIGAMALGAASRSQDIWVAIFILCGVSTFLASYLARTYGSDERRASLLRVKALNHLLREIEAFQLIHGHEISREWDEKIDGFRLSLENMLGNQPGSNSEAAGINLSVEKGIGATNPVSARGSDGTR